jgi:NHL repeat
VAGHRTPADDFVLIVAWLLVALRAHGPDVTFSPEGDIFISDRYINSRIAKADKGGNWIKSWGNRGNNPGEFNTPHNIGADSQGRIYVADHGNRRIQVFDSEGNFLRTLTISVPFDENTRPAIGQTRLEDLPAGAHIHSGRSLDVCIYAPA